MARDFEDVDDDDCINETQQRPSSYQDLDDEWDWGIDIDEADSESEAA